MIDDLLEFLAGKPVNVNDVFHLGKYSASSKRPRPVLIKLTTAWDRASKAKPQGFQNSALIPS